MEEGWIKLYRRLRKHYLWKDKPFTKGQAWVDCLLRANHQDIEILYGWEKVKILRGSFIASERDLAGDWGWSRSKVSRFINVLRNDKMIVTKPNPKANHITILNYKTFQMVPNQQANQCRTSAEPVVNLNKNDKNEKNEKKNTLPEWLALALWKRFLSHRKNVKAPISQDSYHSFIKKFENLKNQGWEPDLVIDTMIEKGWRWFKPEWMKSGPQEDDQRLICRNCKKKSERIIGGLCPKCHEN